jgi:hypothetical protein
MLELGEVLGAVGHSAFRHSTTRKGAGVNRIVSGTRGASGTSGRHKNQLG